ncbi:methyltransferase family protein [Sphingomonas profundi]|uniref:methyltransferase family protein n=1 Tax=Alterirhizorhabdus profundi TaxID=2681549 RepID=UPI0012E96B5E|nr:isoprenylcysteine carboxylmethyltransferase family protein [Sphingomonas profundi]
MTDEPRETGEQAKAGDPRPRSAVSGAVGLAGLCGLTVWILVARQFGMGGALSALVAVLACGVPMMLWSLLIDRVHRNPTTGIDWDAPPRPLRDTLDISLAKLAGLWSTWCLIAIVYACGRWYWEGAYLFAMGAFQWTAPVLVAVSIPYVMWLDRRLIEPRDGAYAFGSLLLGTGAVDRAALAEHARQWAVKGFFTAFMISIVPGNYADVVNWDVAAALTDPVALTRWLIAVMFLIDVTVATVGYLLTCKPLDAHIRSANPYAAGWAAALICYPPFIMMGPGGPLNYHVGTQEWPAWLAGQPLALAVAGAVLVALTAIYAWATVAFGLRFSNLTHRGILTHGPYRWSKHPAYLSKNLFWWLSSMPFLVTTGSLTDMVRNTAILAAVNAVYYWRARTEERHLGADPAYRAYAAWMERNAPLPRLLRWLKGGAGATPQPAE